MKPEIDTVHQCGRNPNWMGFALGWRSEYTVQLLLSEIGCTAKILWTSGRQVGTVVKLRGLSNGKEWWQVALEGRDSFIRRKWDDSQAGRTEVDKIQGCL